MTKRIYNIQQDTHVPQHTRAQQKTESQIIDSNKYINIIFLNQHF